MTVALIDDDEAVLDSLRMALERLERAPDTEPHGMVRLLARVTGVGIETADLLVHEVLLRPMRIVALARKLLIALWQLVREGVVPEGVTMRPA
jgi:hypothetical protein